MKLRYRIVLIYAIIGITLFFGIASYLNTYYRAEQFKNIEEGYIVQLHHLEFALDEFLINVKRDLDLIANYELVQTPDDSDFTNYLEADPETFNLDPGIRERHIIELFNDYRLTHPYVNSVYMGRKSGVFVRSHPRGKNTAYDPRVRPWYKLAEGNPGEIMITDPYKSVTTDDINLGVVSALLDWQDDVYGVVGIDVTLKNLTDYLSQVDIGRSGWICLWNGNGTILVSKKTELVMSNYYEIESDVKIRDLLASQNEGSFVTNAFGVESYGYFRGVKSMDWKIVILVPKVNVDNAINKIIGNIMLMLFTTLVVLAAVTYLGFNRYVLKPIETLNKGARYIMDTGDLQHIIDYTSNDEVGDLTDSFNDMISAINLTQDSLMKSEEELIEHRDHLEELVVERTKKLSVLNQAIEQSPSSIIITKPNGRIEYVNKKFTQMTGYCLDEAIDKEPSILKSEKNDSSTFKEIN